MAKIIKMARNAYEAWTAHKADLSADTGVKAKLIADKLKAYDKANGEQEAMKAALIKKTAEVNALGKEIGELRADMARLVDAKLPRGDERRKLFRNDA